jgi:hypothetical protein
VETIWERVVLLAALFRLLSVASAGQSLRDAFRAPRHPARELLIVFSMAFALLRSGWVAYLGYGIAALLCGRDLSKRPVATVSAALVLSTALTHAVFFGSGRYGLVCAVLLCAATAAEPPILAN